MAAELRLLRFGKIDPPLRPEAFIYSPLNFGNYFSGGKGLAVVIVHSDDLSILSLTHWSRSLSHIHLCRRPCWVCYTYKLHELLKTRCWSSKQGIFETLLEKINTICYVIKYIPCSEDHILRASNLWLQLLKILGKAKATALTGGYACLFFLNIKYASGIFLVVNSKRIIH